MVKLTTLFLASLALLTTSISAANAAAALPVTPAPSKVAILGNHALKSKPKTQRPPQKQQLQATLTKEQKSILDTHNKYRAMHGAPALTWNTKAASFGNNWIQQCQFQHSRGPYGENLAAGYRDFKTSIAAWYNEVKDYNFNRPGFAGSTGHFTQVVWKSTRSIGCAKKFCPGSNWNIYICEYDPPGNWNGPENYRKNVLPRQG